MSVIFIRLTDHLGNTGQDFAIVHFNTHTYAETTEHFVHDLDKFHLVQQRIRPDDIAVALIELPIASFLRPVGTPYGLYLVTLERKREIVAMLHDKADEEYGQIIA